MTLDQLKDMLDDQMQEKENALIRVGMAMGKIELLQRLISEGEQSPSDGMTLDQLKTAIGADEIEEPQPID